MTKQTSMLILVLLIVTFFSQNAFAYVDVSSVTRLDLSKERIAGKTVPYHIQLSKLWTSYLIADREHVNGKNGILEKINFYYVAQGDVVSKPSLFLSFYVYDKNYWSERSVHRKLVQTEEHVFAINSTNYNHFTNSTDKAIFERLLEEANDDEYMRNSLAFPEGTKIVTSNTIIVSGKTINEQCFTGENGAIYIPVRSVCIELGYTVDWLPNEKIVTVSKKTDKEDYYYLLTTQDNRKHQGFEAVIAENKTYVSTMFFIHVIGVNVSIDENNNVYITT